MEPDRLPVLGRGSFACPHCHAFTQQTWISVHGREAESPPCEWDADKLQSRLEELKNDEETSADTISLYVNLIRAAREGLPGVIKDAEGGYCYKKFWNMHVSRCFVCTKETVWIADRIIFPHSDGEIEDANPDLPPDIAADYAEAAKVVMLSPRSAAALLRLAIQKLCSHLLSKNADINSMIGELVKAGLPVKIQKALDYVRVIGNEAVHPGTMDLRDDRETALGLFKLVNVVADVMITQPTHIDEIYAGLPESKRNGIDQRDAIKD